LRDDNVTRGVVAASAFAARV